ncbi:MAG: hypothetical protein ACKV2T_06455 [Kofleriaceae bacterium]
MDCTLFSVTLDDIASPGTEVELPSIGDRTSKVSAALGRPHVVQLGGLWKPLHDALGEHPGDHPLGFLGGGGEPFKPLDDGARSHGRFFTPAQTIKMLAAIARVTEDHLMRNIARNNLAVPAVAELIRALTKLRVFLAEAVTGDRGVIVHHLG